MTHLTTQQILQTVDGTADYATQAAVTSHLAVCPTCRREMDFHRALIRSARRTPLPAVSERFTRNVMARVQPRTQNPVAAWIFNNMGNLFALMAVLGVLWGVLSQPVSFGEWQGSNQGDQIVDEWSRSLRDGYAWVNSALTAATRAPAAERTTTANGNGTERLWLMSLSLAALLALDRLWLNRRRLRLDR